jgi:acyl dehydratase/NAD(P)-dependent dehydrogenase (short-subunit alcohol dehydrogenase family)
MQDQMWFARATGDSNPLHLDARWAERTFPGAVVVHGVHALLWALDQAVSREGGTELAGVSATFVKPILLGDEVALEWDKESLTAKLKVRGELVTRAQLARTWRAKPPATPNVGEAEALAPTEDARLLAAAFPDLARAIGARRLGGLGLLSTVVGTRRPGLNGVFAGLEVDFDAAPGEAISYGVERRSPALSRLELWVSGLGLSGRIFAFEGGSPVPNVGSSDAGGLVGPTEFAGAAPLVIGASSGLGAATAALLRAGGATPILTSRDETALAQLRESLTAGGDVAAVAFDVRDPQAGLARVRQLGWRGGQLYYFASPRIFRRRIEPYQGADLREFLAVYVEGFYEIVRALMEARDGQPLTVLYPSTVAIDERAADLFEYRIAKQAGEEVCDRLAERYRALTVLKPRLPRIATRQTQSFVRMGASGAEAAMLPLVRAVQGRVSGLP